MTPGYNDAVFQADTFAPLLERTRPALDALLKQYKTKHIALCGKSGMALGFGLLATGLDFNPVIVRKRDDGTHAGQVEFIRDFDSEGRVIFLDDLISSGRTATHVRDRLEGRSMQMVAIALWEDWGSQSNWNGIPRHII